LPICIKLQASLDQAGRSVTSRGSELACGRPRPRDERDENASTLRVGIVARRREAATRTRSRRTLGVFFDASGDVWFSARVFRTSDVTRMPTFPTRAAASTGAAAPRAASPADPDLGAMPEWSLADLYASPDDPNIAADLARASSDGATFKALYQGKLASLAMSGGAALLAPVQAYEALSDRIGRLGSYAGLLYAADTSDTVRAKFYGDIQEKITALTTDLIFFELELNTIPDDVLKSALEDPAIARYRPWFEDLRQEKPFQLDEKLEKLFHEKSTTSRASWNRLFNETMTALRFEVEGEPGPTALEPTLNMLTSPDG
jgi:oligoendopeptidase F